MTISDILMKHKLKQVMVGALMTACVSVTSAGETPNIFSSIDYKAMSHQMSHQEMVQVLGQGGITWRAIPEFKLVKRAIPKFKLVKLVSCLAVRHNSKDRPPI